MSDRPLWAPWRIDYVTGPTPDACPFCSAAAGHDPDAELIIARSNS